MKSSKKILESVQSENAQKLLKEIYQVRIPSLFKEFTSEYYNIGGTRNEFLWKWVHKLTTSRNPGFMLSCVPKEFAEKAALVKDLLVLDVVISDDVADKHKNNQLLMALLKVPFEDKLTGSVSSDVNLSKKIWKESAALLKKAPRWNDFREIFMYDMKQTWNSFLYSYVVNTNLAMLNYTETKIYGAHNMIFYLFADIDLMFSPTFEINELPLLREAVWEGQQMARIGNWLSTWERELKETDFSSGVFGHAVSEGIITPSELEKSISDPKIAEEIKQKIKSNDIERNLLEEWELHRDNVLKLASKVNSIDLREYVGGLELLLKYHLASTGKK